jgi:hypothetical protein
MEVSGQLHAPAIYPREKNTGSFCIGCWVGPRTDLDDVKKRKIFSLQGLEIRHLGLPARSQSLYRFDIPAPFYLISSINYDLISEYSLNTKLKYNT